MANYQSLKAAINAVIKANGKQQITGTALNEVLLAMVNSLGSGYQFAGVATPITDPGTPDQKVFYIALESGTYTHFGGATVPQGISILKFDSSWSLEVLYIVDDSPTINSRNLAKSSGIYVNGLRYVPVNTDTELFDRSTTIQNMDINTITGVLVPNDNYCCSPLIPLGYRTKVWVEAYDRKLYCYDANGNYLGRTGMDMWGVALSDASSDFANVAFVRILFIKANAATARIGLREKENLVKDYFDYDTLPQLGSEGLVFSEPILNCINDKIATLRAMGFDDLKLLYKSGNTVVTINDNFNRLALIGKVSAGSSFSFIFNELLRHHALKCYVTVFSTYDLAVQDYSGYALQNISGGWKTTDIDAIINYDGYISIDVDNQNSSNYTIRELEDVVRNLNIVIDKKTDNSYYLNSWVKGDWSNGTDGPYLTARQYKIRNANWLFLKKGTIIEGFFISTGQTAHVDIWDATSGTAIDVNTNRTSDFKVTLAQDSKVLVWTSSAVQNPTNTDITINVRITEPSPMNVNKVTKLRIATFNTGDYTFANSSIVKGSDDARTKFREVVTDIDADIIATQEDVPFFNDTTKSLPRDEVFGMYKYGYRPGIVFGWDLVPENNPNYHGFYSALQLVNVRGEWYNLTSEQAPLLGHYMFAAAELHIDGKVIAIANVHYDWSDKNARALQVQKVLDFCSQYKYAIIIGDFNPENRVAQYNSSTDKWESIVNYPKYLYSEEWQTYKDAGYIMANDGYFGTFNTCEDEGGWHPYDNIICSQNIAINKAWMVEKSYMNDHKPVVAEIIIY